MIEPPVLHMFGVKKERIPGLYATLRRKHARGLVVELFITHDPRCPCALADDSSWDGCSCDELDITLRPLT